MPSLCFPLDPPNWKLHFNEMARLPEHTLKFENQRIRELVLNLSTHWDLLGSLEQH